MDQGYQRFKIPPNFDLVELHKESSYLFLQSSKTLEICPCCDKIRKQQRVPYCKGQSQLAKYGEQIPMLFYFLKATSFFLAFIIFAKIADYQICNLIEEGRCQMIYAQFVIPSLGNVQIPAGFKQTNQDLSFAQFLIFLVSIIVLKISIKMKKYRVKQKTRKLVSNRTLKLINVHKCATIQQIKQSLLPYKVEVVLTFKVKQLEECLTNINRLLKMKKIKHQRKGSFITETISQIDTKLKDQRRTLCGIKAQLKKQKNRLSIAFVIFTSNAEKKQAHYQLKKSLPSRLFYKLCTCCSETSIRGQSFTVKEADQPGDIIWTNLQNPYLRTKLRRLASIFVCVILLAFGVATQYLFTEITDQNTFLGPLIKTFVVLALNFIIVALLQYSTENLEHYESQTERHLTLVKKMTVFLFVNISLSPLLGYYFSLEKEQKQQPIREVLFANFCFSVLCLAIGNISKPFPLWLSVERVLKTFKKWSQRRKRQRCVLTQIEANKQFEPIEFPISTFYSLSLSSFLMVCFYVNAFQILILVELISLVFIYFVSKWMLLRVCKSPAGLARRISNLAQSLLRLVIFIYWIGKVLLTYINLNEEDKIGLYGGFFGYMFRNAYGYIECILSIVCVVFLEYFVKFMARFILGKMHAMKSTSVLQSQQRLLQRGNQTNNEYEGSYANANLHLKLEQECDKFEQSQSLVQKMQRQREKKNKKIFR